MYDSSLPWEIKYTYQEAQIYDKNGTYLFCVSRRKIQSGQSGQIEQSRLAEFIVRKINHTVPSGPSGPSGPSVSSTPGISEIYDKNNNYLFTIIHGKK
jgi:hypothetical protein